MEGNFRDGCKQVRRQRLIRRLLKLIALGLTAWGCVALWNYVHRPDFHYGHVVIQGTNKLDEEKIIKMAGQQPPFNRFKISAGDVKYALEQDVRFDKVEVEYKGLSELHIVVQEREPALYVSNAYHSYFQLDRSGVVLNVTKGIPDAKAPLLVGEQCGNVYIGDKIGNKHVHNVLEFMGKLKPEILDQIAEIANDGEKGMTLRLRSGIVFLLGPAEELVKRSELFMTVYKEIKGKNIPAEYIDLTFAKPYIKLKEEAMKVQK